MTIISYVVPRSISAGNQPALIDTPQTTPFIDRELVIVTGAQGVLGQYFLKTFENMPESVKVVGIHRRPLTDSEVSSATYRQSDILDYPQLFGIFNDLINEQTSRITIIHTVGGFKYEPDGKPSYDPDHDGIDDQLLESNVKTAVNVLEGISNCPVWSKCLIPIRFIGFGSLVEEHQFPHFHSYDNAKAELKKYLQLRHKEIPNCEVRIFNIPTLDTQKERDVRPFAENPQYWLRPEELVTCVLKELSAYDKEGCNGYKECGVAVACPDFDLMQFKNDHAERWRRETGHDHERL